METKPNNVDSKMQEILSGQRGSYNLTERSMNEKEAFLEVMNANQTDKTLSTKHDERMRMACVGMYMKIAREKGDPTTLNTVASEWIALRNTLLIYEQKSPQSDADLRAMSFLENSLDSKLTQQERSNAMGTERKPTADRAEVKADGVDALEAKDTLTELEGNSPRSGEEDTESDDDSEAALLKPENSKLVQRKSQRAGLRDFYVGFKKLGRGLEFGLVGRVHRRVELRRRRLGRV